MTTDVDDAYLASAVDMDGNVALFNHNSELRLPVLQVVQKNYWFLTVLQEKYPGGNIICAEDAWSLRWTKASIIKGILEKICHHMIIKRDIAEVVYAVCASMEDSGVGRNMTDQQRLTRYKLEEIYDRRVKEMKEKALIAPEGMRLREGEN